MSENKISREVISALRQIVGSDYISTTPYKLLYYHTPSLSIPVVDIETGEPLDISKMSGVAVRPSSAEQISEIMKLANRERFKVRIWGAGTSIPGGALPARDEVVLDLSRMRWIRLIEEDQYVEVGPAVKPLKLKEYLEKFGYTWSAYPGSYRSSSIGGNICINTSGHTVDAYTGKPGDWVLGLEVVLPTGEIIETGHRTLRQPAGPDLTRLFIGSEGLFGVITNIRLRLRRRPLEEARAVVIFRSMDYAAKAIQQIFYDRTPYPLWLELMDTKYADLGYALVNMEPPGGPCLQIVTDGYMPGEAEWKLEQILNACKKAKPKTVQTAFEDEEWDNLIRVREMPMVVFKKFMIAPPVDPPLSKIADVIKAMYQMKEKVKTVDPDRLELLVWGHVGGITVHCGIFFGGEAEGLDPKTHWKLYREWIQLVTEEIHLKYGCSWGEQGFIPGQFDWWLGTYGPKSYELLKGIKKLFDPNNVLNPIRPISS